MPQVSANGVVTNYERTGSGPPFVLLHGGEADRTMFSGLVPLLAHECSVIAPDQRDSGMTTNPPDEYGLNELADDVAALIGGLGLARANVFGTSYGGQVAQVLAARHPQAIDRLILSSTWRVNNSPMSFAPEVFQALANLRSDVAANAPKIASYFLSPEALKERPELIEIFRGGKRNAEQSARRGAVLAKPATGDFSKFDRPTLILAGENDRLIPNGETFAIADLIPHARTQTLPGASHIAAIEKPQLLADAVIAFLNEDRQ